MIGQLVSLIKKIPYWYVLVIPYAALYLGIGMNQLALVTNHNQMPVDWPQSMWAQCEADPVAPQAEQGDLVHSCMTEKTHLKFLCDWIMIGNPTPDYIMSPGDIFIFTYEMIAPYMYFLWFVLMVKEFFGGKSVVQAKISNSGDRAAPGAERSV